MFRTYDSSIFTVYLGGGSPLLDSREKAIKAARVAAAKKAKDTRILELRDISTIADYFIICSGESSIQVKSIAEAIEEEFSKENILPQGREGLNFARWVLLDYGDVVMHIFDQESRVYYELEKFWLDAPRIPFEEASGVRNRKQKS